MSSRRRPNWLLIRRELTRRNHRRRAATEKIRSWREWRPGPSPTFQAGRSRKRARRSKRWPARIERAHWIARSPLGSQLISTFAPAKRRRPRRRETKRGSLSQRRRSARELAKRIGEAPKLFKQIVSQFSADIAIANLGNAAWSRAPRPQGRHAGYDIRFDDVVPRIIATQEALSSVRLPGFSKHDLSALERAFHHEDEDSEDFGAVMAQQVRELRELIRNHDQRRVAISDESVARAVARAQAVLVSEYNKTCRAIRELLALDAQLTAAEAGARYPDGALIFDPALFPEHWHLGLMSKSINGYPRVALPVIDGMALAAE